MGDVIEILTTATNTVEVEAQGPQGIPGVGVPTGGSPLQVLRKKTGTDYDTEWAAAGSGSGSVTSVALASTDLTISGSPITDSGTITANIAANAVTLEKLQTISSEHLLGRHGSGNGGVQQVGLGTGLAISGSNVGVTFGSSAGTACEGNDARLSDARTPSSTLAHASSHASSGSDPLAPSDIGAQSIFATEALGTVTADVTLTAARAKIYTLNTTTSGLRILLPTTNVQTGDVVQIRFVSQNGSTIAPVRGTLTGFFGNSIRSGQQVTFIAESTSGTSWEETATNRTPPETITLTAGDVVVGKATSGAGTATQVSIGTEENSVARGNHVHGNLTNDGKLGSTAGLPVVTTTAGAVTTLALGTANQVLRVNSGATGVEFADASGGVTGAAASASDVLGVSGANITGVDANADRIVYWNNTANKLAYGTPADAGAAAASHTHTSADINSQTASNGHVLTANGSGGSSFAALPASGISNVDSTLADVMSVSGSNLVADDGGLVDSSNPVLTWDDAAGKAVWANPLRRTAAGAFYVGVAPTTTALGTNAINIQPSRALATQVASGQETVNIGVETTASGGRCIVLGWRASSTGTDGVVVGRSSSAGQQAACFGSENTASGLASVAVGNAVTANAQDSVAIGSYNANDNGLLATAIRAVGLNAIANLRAMFATRPFNAVYWGGQTTNNTATILNLDAAATNRFTIAASTALAVDILLVARRSDVADKWLVARRFLGIRRDGSNNTSLIGAVQTLGTDQSAGSPTWTFALTADDTNEALQLEVTGATGETVQWRATAIYRVV